MLLRPGDLLEGDLETYLITATISRGAYGCAFLARTPDGVWRVVKQFEPTEDLAASDEDYQRRCFEREADIVTRYHSPLMVRGYELLRRADEVFLVMEHVEGQTLRYAFDQRRLTAGRPYQEPAVRAIGQQLCEVLDWLHRLPGQLIYRDLKPANVMWDAVAGRLKLIDFGTARFNADGRQATQGLGTDGYAPPELYGSREALTPATDVYTIGAVLYELVTGSVPPSRATPIDFRGFDEALSEPFRAAVIRALQQDPGLRWQSAAALGAALAAEAVPATTALWPRPRNLHPLLACYCPVCGREPTAEAAIYCGADGAMYHVALLRLVPRHRPATSVYLDRPELTIGRLDPEQGIYPEVDVSAADPSRHVSRRHAVLRRTGLRYQIEGLPTGNPTRVDGAELPAGSVREVAPGTRFEFADLAATLLLKPVVDEPPAGWESVG